MPPALEPSSPLPPSLLKLLSHRPGTKLASSAAIETRESTMEVLEVSIAIMKPSLELAPSGRFFFEGCFVLLSLVVSNTKQPSKKNLPDGSSSKAALCCCHLLS